MLTEKKGYTRREFLKPFTALVGGLGLAGCSPDADEADDSSSSNPSPAASSKTNSIENTSLRLLWTGDIHGQIRPIYHRDPFDQAYLEAQGIEAGSVEAYISSSVDFVELAKKYGKVGGLANLATLIKKERAVYPEKTILLDAGDTWTGSAICLFTEGRVAVEAMNAMGYDAMTIHWEMNLGTEAFLDRVDESQFAVIAQNLVDNDFEDRVLEASIIKEIGDIRVAIVGQAYPFTLGGMEATDVEEDFRMGYRDNELQDEITRVRDEDGADIVILLSHMGYPQDVAMAGRLKGVDVIVGGHTHDILWQPHVVGETLILQAGSHGKLLGKLDLEIADGKIVGYEHQLIPVLSEQIEPDAEVAAIIAEFYAPYQAELDEIVGKTNSLLYRSSLFGGTTEAFMGEAYREIAGTDLTCVGGWRYGATLLPDSTISVEDVYNVMKATASPLYTAKLSGSDIRVTLESNLVGVFSSDPYELSGGEAMRCTGIEAMLDRDADYMARLSDLKVNGVVMNDEQVYTVATSGGRIQDRDPEHEATERSAVEELIDYIRVHSPIQADEPMHSFTELD